MNMALQAFRTVTSETSEFEAARARWERVSAERRALREKLDGCKAALVLADYKPAPGEYMSPVLEDRARRYLAGRIPDRDRLTRQIADLEYELNEAASTYAIESAAWKLALENEARRRAEALRPRHRAAVRKIAQLVEQLSAAVEQEREVRRELGEVGSTALVDAGCELGSLADYNSPLSVWNRRVLQAGLLEP
jgi:hypothetical protein